MTTPFLDLPDIRRIAMRQALNHDALRFADQQGNFFSDTLPLLITADLCALEFADESGDFHRDVNVYERAVACLDVCATRFGSDGRVQQGDGNTPYFTLVPFTSALLALRDHADPAWHTRMVERAVKLTDDAATHIDRTHHYLNPRALEALSMLQLHQLTDEKRHLDRCRECLDNLLLRQYPSGAQMYHTGAWVWGRRPAQGYQFLSAEMMLQCGVHLGDDDVKAYVRRIMDYSLLATDRRGYAFTTLFEGLHKSRSGSSAGRQWVIASALGDPRYDALARATYDVWSRPFQREDDARTSGLEQLCSALRLGIRRAPRDMAFRPPQGVFALDDISTVYVHDNRLDLGFTLLTGYSAFAEGDCGSVKLYAVTPELTDAPTYRNAGTDALRGDWRTPSEQIDCCAQDQTALLHGWVYTGWEDDKDQKRPPSAPKAAFNRRLEVKMSYSARELVLEYRTVKSWQHKPIPSRLLFLLSAKPVDAAPTVVINDVAHVVPAADSGELYLREGPVATARFVAPDGAYVEIIPEVSRAERITLERPEQVGRQTDPRRRVPVKPANEGCLRLAFDGPHALDEGRYRIRFHPGD